MKTLTVLLALFSTGCVSLGYHNRKMIEQELREKNEVSACLGSLDKEMRYDDNVRQWVADKYGVEIPPPK